MLLKRIISFVIALNSFVPVYLVSGQHYTQLLRHSGLHGEFRSQSSHPIAMRPSALRVKEAPLVIPVDSITGIFSSAATSISSAWSAIPTEIKIVGCFATVLSLPHLYSCLKRWWYSSEKKVKDSKKEDEKHIDPIDNFNLEGAEEVQHASLQQPLVKQLLRHQGAGILKLDGITTPGDTPSGADLILERPVEKVMYDIACDYYKDTLSTAEINEVVESAIRQLPSYPGLEQATSFAKDSAAYGLTASILHEQVRKHSAFEQFVETRKMLLFDRLAKKQGERALQSVESLLSKVDGEILDVFDANVEIAVVRITVPNQQGLACGAHAIVNMKVMDQLVKNKKVANLLQESRNCFDRVSRESPLEENADLNNSTAWARSIGLSDMSLAVIREGQEQSLFDYGVYVENVKNISGSISQLVKRKTPAVHILLNSTSKAGDGDHRQHWSGISIVYTQDMAKPVIVLMDSLKNEWSSRAKGMVQVALKHIAVEVNTAICSQPRDIPVQAKSCDEGKWGRTYIDIQLS